MPDAELQTLWLAHRGTPFPVAARGVEVRGVDLVLLDSLASGCVSSLVEVDCERDVTKASLLGELAPQIESVLPLLDGETRAYFSQLGRVVAAAIRVSGSREIA